MSEGKTDTGRFVLLDDVEHLKRLLAGLDPEDDETLSCLQAELLMKLKESQMVRLLISRWS